MPSPSIALPPLRGSTYVMAVALVVVVLSLLEAQYGHGHAMGGFFVDLGWAIGWLLAGHAAYALAAVPAAVHSLRAVRRDPTRDTLPARIGRWLVVVQAFVLVLWWMNA